MTDNRAQTATLRAPTAGQFRKRPVVVDAVQWTGDESCLAGTPFERAYVSGMIQRIDKAIPVKTPHGEVLCRVGDWIVLDAKGQPYPCEADIFAATHEPAIGTSESEREMTPRQREPRYWISGVAEGSDAERHYVRGAFRACAMLGFRIERSEPRALRVGGLVMSELYAVPTGSAVPDVCNHPSECDKDCGCKEARAVPQTTGHVSRERFNAVLGKWIPEEIADAIDAELFDTADLEAAYAATMERAGIPMPDVTGTVGVDGATTSSGGEGSIDNLGELCPSCIKALRAWMNLPQAIAGRADGGSDG